MPLNVWTTWPAIECLQSRKSYRAIYKGPCICQVWSAVNISNFKKKGTALQYWKQTSLSMLWCYKEGVKSHSEHNHSFPMIVLNEGKYETKQGDIIVILGGVKKSSLHSKKKKKKKYNTIHLAPHTPVSHRFKPTMCQTHAFLTEYRGIHISDWRVVKLA